MERAMRKPRPPGGDCLKPSTSCGTTSSIAKTISTTPTGRDGWPSTATSGRTETPA